MSVVTIKKGNHYPCFAKYSFAPLIYLKDEIYFQSIINIPFYSFFAFPGEDVLDYNKLYGVSFGHHHKNESYRYGFRMGKKGWIDISLYYYIKGKRFIEFLTVLQSDKKYCYNIFIDKKNKKILFSITDFFGYRIINTVSKDINNFKLFGYTLGPYIGGNLTAPKDVDIIMELI